MARERIIESAHDCCHLVAVEILDAKGNVISTSYKVIDANGNVEPYTDLDSAYGAFSNCVYEAKQLLGINSTYMGM